VTTTDEEGTGRPARCYRHRYLAILRRRSVSTDRQRSMSITVTRTNLTDAWSAVSVPCRPQLRSVTDGGFAGRA